jgi:hypothetical protein
VRRPVDLRPAGSTAPPSFLKRPIAREVAPPPQGGQEGVVPVALRRGRHAAKRETVDADMGLDTVPIEHGGDAVVYSLCETTATGLRKFDLGNVPASVTPPRSWRRAAWFAVGTSAAVVLGLTVAAAELMGRPTSDSTFIDAMPAYPTGPLTLDKLPNEETTTFSPRPESTTRNTPSKTPADESQPVSAPAEAPRDTVIGGTTGDGTTGNDTTEPPSQGTTTTPNEPTRRTVGPAPVTPTDPAAMGDRTEQYFKLVTSDAAAAHAMTTGGMAREGTEGIEARYAGVRRVEVHDITIDRNQAITRSTIKVVHDDGTETIEHRQLTFTWGGDPKITEDATTG